MPSPPTPVSRKLLRLPQVMERTGLKRAIIYRKAKQGLFPRPVKITERASGWLESEVNDYIDRVTQQRDASMPAAKGEVSTP